jgi:hypothetical protein
VPNRANVDVRFVALEFSLCHYLILKNNVISC